MYKPGDKFVIEITGKENGAYVSERFAQGSEMRTVFPECMLDSFEKLDSDYINEHFGNLQDEAYKHGMNDTWELAKKISMHKSDGGIPADELKRIFNEEYIAKIYKNNTVHQAKAKIEAWEKSKAEIKVGDIVEIDSERTIPLVVSYVDNDGFCYMLNKKGKMRIAQKKNLVKIGRTIDIASVLEQIGGSR